jgi:hypothetical protein
MEKAGAYPANFWAEVGNEEDIAYTLLTALSSEAGAGATPAAAWEAVLHAMKSGDTKALAGATTERGRRSILHQRDGTDISPQTMRRYGDAWAGWPLRAVTKDGGVVVARIGPAVKEHRLTFVKTEAGWKFDE